MSSDLSKIVIQKFCEEQKERGWSVRRSASMIGADSSHLNKVLSQKIEPSPQILLKMIQELGR